MARPTDRCAAIAAGRRVAAFDVGSNTVRGIAAVLSPDGVLRPYHAAEQMTALGKGLAQTGRLRVEGIEQTAQFVADFLAQAGTVAEVFCVGTAASRDAANTADLADALQTGVGVTLEVISPEEEAALAFTGAMLFIPSRPFTRYALMDVGGRSTEVIRGDRKGFWESVSLAVGARSLTEAFLRDDPPTRAQTQAAREHVMSLLPCDMQAKLRATPGCAATGGTAQAAALLAGGNWSLRPAELGAICERLAGMTLAQRRAAMEFDPERAEVIVGGLIILDALFGLSRATHLLISPGSVREGLLLERTGAVGMEAVGGALGGPRL